MDDLHAFLALAGENGGAGNGAARSNGSVRGGAVGTSAGLAAIGAAANGDTDGLERRLELADALRRVVVDVMSKLDVEEMLAGLVEHAMVLFQADRAAVMKIAPDGRYVPAVARGLSERYLKFVERLPVPSLPLQAVAERRALHAVDYANDPRGAGVRPVVVQEGFDTIAVAPMFSGDELLGLLLLYHDRRHPWSRPDLEALEALAAQASVAIVTARSYAKTAGWAAQLSSIQQLGGRLSRLSTVREIAAAMATELRELIDYHNVRVYTVAGRDLVPVAWWNETGKYEPEDEAKLRLQVGEGITGWVAEHAVAQYLPDAAKDSRARTVAGTKEDEDESMLVAPMMYEDRVLGVLVLSKLGLHQFSSDELRLLEIYASLAAQAMTNAETTERLNAQSAALERQLRSQRELLRITESILTTLEPTVVLDEIADRLAGLVTVDNIALFVLDAATASLRPLIARGSLGELYMRRPIPAFKGIVGWVFEHGEGQLVPDELADERVYHFAELGPVPGSIIAVPLKGRAATLGVLLLERLGPGRAFDAEEFELVELFAGHASIAMQNAQQHHAVEVRARTDALTGLSNHGTFHERLAEAVKRGEPFGLLMLDLDDFKSYNDRYGHQAGDALLRRLAEGLVATVREGDTVFRYGGDEFALILPNTATRGGAGGVAEKVRDAVRSIRVPGRRTFWPVVTCSIGVASFPADGADKEGLLLAADRACYLAKREGRDRIATAEEGRALASEFRLAAPTPVDEPSIPAD